MKLLWSAPIGFANKFARPDASEDRVYLGTHDGRVISFGSTHHQLTVTREPAAGGTVTSAPAGIDCGQICSASIADGTRLTLTAKPAAGYRFGGWSGACTGSGTCQVTMYSDQSLSATFIAEPQPPLPSAAAHNPPGTTLAAAKIDRRHRTARFRFRSTDAGDRFECRLVRPKGAGRPPGRARFSRCASPKVYRHLPRGRYTFLVRASNEYGHDATPARRRFRI